MEIKFNGSKKQNKWATVILQNANLTEELADNLLRYGGPTMHGQGIMDVTIVIENRDNLTAYAESLGEFYKLSDEEKHDVAENAVDTFRLSCRLDKPVPRIPSIAGNCGEFDSN